MALHQRSPNADQKDLFPVRRVCVYGSNLPDRSASFFCRRCNSTSSSCSQCTSSSRSSCSTCQEAHEKATCTSWLQPSQQVLSPPSSLLSKASPLCKTPSSHEASPQEASPQRVRSNPNMKGGDPPFFFTPYTTFLSNHPIANACQISSNPSNFLLNKEAILCSSNEAINRSKFRIFGIKSAKI